MQQQQQIQGDVAVACQIPDQLEHHQPVISDDWGQEPAQGSLQDPAAFYGVGAAGVTSECLEQEHEDLGNSAQQSLAEYEEYEHVDMDGKRTTKKKSKGGRIASEITREELSNCFNMASEEAAKKLGVGLTVLKRICRKFGVPRWPYRKLKSLDRLISNVETGQAPGETYRHLMKSAEEIRERQQAMCTGQMQDLDEQTKRLQQAYSKFNHKLRKATREDEPLGEVSGGTRSSSENRRKEKSSRQQVQQPGRDGLGSMEASTVDANFVTANTAMQDHTVGVSTQALLFAEQGQQAQQHPAATACTAAQAPDLGYNSLPSTSFNMPPVSTLQPGTTALTNGNDLYQAQSLGGVVTEPGEEEVSYGVGKVECISEMPPGPTGVEGQGTTVDAVLLNGHAEVAVEEECTDAGAAAAAATASAHQMAAATAWPYAATAPPSMMPSEGDPVAAAAAYWKERGVMYAYPASTAAWGAMPGMPVPTAADDPAAAAAAAAVAASYYVSHPMAAATYMQAAAAAATGGMPYGYPAAYLQAYLPGYDPLAYAQHYSLWRPQQLPTVVPAAAPSSVPRAPDTGADGATGVSGAGMDPQQAGASQGHVDPYQQQVAAQAQAQAAYYAQYQQQHQMAVAAYQDHQQYHHAAAMAGAAAVAAAAAAAGHDASAAVGGHVGISRAGSASHHNHASASSQPLNGMGHHQANGNGYVYGIMAPSPDDEEGGAHSDGAVLSRGPGVTGKDDEPAANGKRKRRPNIKYANAEYDKGSDSDEPLKDARATAGGVVAYTGAANGEEPAESVAHTLMHMASTGVNGAIGHHVAHHHAILHHAAVPGDPSVAAAAAAAAAAQFAMHTGVMHGGTWAHMATAMPGMGEMPMMDIAGSAHLMGARPGAAVVTRAGAVGDLGTSSAGSRKVR